MATRHALALVQPHALRRLPARPRRLLAVATGIVAALGLLYLGARETPVFSVREVAVEGGPPSLRSAVRSETEETLGESLVALDGGELVRRLEALPSVRSARYDRAFPHTLRVFVVPERPLAAVWEGQRGWVVSERGRIIRAVQPGKAWRYPKIRLPERSGLQPGAFVNDRTTFLLLDALARVPKGFPMPIHALRVEQGELTLILRGGAPRPELRLGEPVEVGVKLAAAGVVLGSLSAQERTELGYLDVSLPDRPVAAAKSQL